MHTHCENLISLKWYKLIGYWTIIQILLKKYLQEDFLFEHQKVWEIPHALLPCHLHNSSQIQDLGFFWYSLLDNLETIWLFLEAI